MFFVFVFCLFVFCFVFLFFCFCFLLFFVVVVVVFFRIITSTRKTIPLNFATVMSFDLLCKRKNNKNGFYCKGYLIFTKLMVSV